MGVLDGVAPTHRDRPTDQASRIESVNTSAFTVTNGQMTSGLLFIRKEHINSSLPFIELRVRKAGHRSESKHVKIMFRPISE